MLTEFRAVDVLVDRLGGFTTVVHGRSDVEGPLVFMGHSAGGFLGGYLAGLDPRLSKVAIFGYGAQTFSRLARYEMHRAGHTLTPRELRILGWLEPGNYVRVPHRRELFVQHGISDTEVPIAEARALFSSAAGSKRWAEYPCGHGIDADPAARADRADFVFN